MYTLECVEKVPDATLLPDILAFISTILKRGKIEKLELLTSKVLGGVPGKGEIGLLALIHVKFMLVKLLCDGSGEYGFAEAHVKVSGHMRSYELYDKICPSEREIAQKRLAGVLVNQSGDVWLQGVDGVSRTLW